MKTLKFIVIGALLSLSCLHSSAQQERIPINQPNNNLPRLFEDVPQKMSLRVSDMESLFDQPVGASVTAKFSKSFYLQGTVISKADNASVKSVIIKSVNRRDAVFTFTRITNNDGSFSYRGRILSKNNSDAFEVVKEDGQYILQKKNYHELVTE